MFSITDQRHTAKFLVLSLVACGTSAPIISDGGDATVADADAACCNDSVNSSLTPPAASLGYAWTAWKYLPTCSFRATTIELPSDGPAIALLDDASDSPGGVLVAETATTKIGAKIRAQFLPLSIVLGKPIWVALKNAKPGSLSGGSSAPFAAAGQSAPATSANILTGPWDQNHVMVRPIFFIGCGG